MRFMKGDKVRVAKGTVNDFLEHTAEPILKGHEIGTVIQTDCSDFYDEPIWVRFDEDSSVKYYFSENELRMYKKA